MQQVVIEDREEQEILRQQQAEARAATKVTTSHQIRFIIGLSVKVLPVDICCKKGAKEQTDVRTVHMILGEFTHLCQLPDIYNCRVENL